MRYDPSSSLTAAGILSSLSLPPDSASTDELTNIFKQNGNIRHAHVLAKAIVSHRGSKPLNTMADLKELVYRWEPANTESAKFHSLIKTCQALRIMVNGELSSIDKLFDSIPSISPKTGPGLAIFLGFHELEHDLIEKGRKKMRKTFKISEIASSKEPSKEEVERNRPSRSARLYAWTFTPKSEIKSKTRNQ